DDYGFEYNLAAINSTSVVTLEEIYQDSVPEADALRLDDLPVHQLVQYEHRVPESDFVERVQVVHAAAKLAGAKAACAYRETALRVMDGSITGVCGFAKLVVRDSQAELVQALLQLNLVTALSGVGYVI